MNKKIIVDNVTKNIIADYVTKNIKLSVEDKEIVNAIEIAKMEWENAERFFQFVKEPEMIDYAIYIQNAARVRYMHLLKMAKDRKIVSGYYKHMKEVQFK